MATVPARGVTTAGELWYQLDADQVVRALASSRRGLTSEESEARLRRFGPNRLEPRKGPSPLVLLLRQFQSPLVYVLLVAGLVTTLVGHYVDTGVILVVVVVNAVIGYVQETKAAAAMESLLQMTAPTATVLRGGVHTEVEMWQVVPGDVVLLVAGDKVPADLRLLEAHNLQVDEAPMTGESVPVAKSAATIREADLSPADQINMAFAGNTVTSGRGVGIAVATGVHTELGKISRQVTGVEVIETPLQARLHHFSRFLGVVVFALVALVFVLGILAGFDTLDMFLTAVTLAVSAIPEGLPATVTIVLAIGMRRMAERNAIIRRLPAVETLGTADFICTDKTGTLTRNEMTVQTIYAGGRSCQVTGVGYQPRGKLLLEGRKVDAASSATLRMLLAIGALANDARLVEQDGHRKVLGDPTEGALLVAAEKAGLSPDDLRRAHRRHAEIPFESEHQYMATLNHFEGQPMILAKGSPERLLEMCSSQMLDTGRAPLDRERALAEAHRLADQGYRLLALAYKPHRSRALSRQDVEHDLIFVGLQGIIDPPREEVPLAVARCRRAGVRVAMVTGDHRQTAVAIATQLGILRPNDRVLTGRELQTMSDEELGRVVERVAVYARVAPEHKLRIVQQLKARDHIVAVTGDGVNDAPALRAADIGVAMGITGTDVSKETADMVLADDNFATIFAAIEGGRVVFENIRKVIYFLLATNAGEVLTVLAALLVGMPLPLLPVQILWINLVTDSSPVIALGFEPGEREYLLRPPRHPKSEMLSRVLQMRILMVAALMATGTLSLFALELAFGASLAEARTVAFTTLVLFQFFDVLNARSINQSILSRRPLSNPYLVGGILLGLVLQLSVVYVPPAQEVMQTTFLGPGHWAMMVPVAASALLAVEIEKLVRRRFGLVDTPTGRR